MAEGILVRDECVCGRRYRVKNPTAGFKFRCPSCQREIEITQADILLAEPVEPLPTSPPGSVAAVASDETSDEPLDVIPLDDAELHIAEHGSSIGAFNKIGYSSADAQLRAALSPRSLMNTMEDDELSRFGPIAEKAQVQRTFRADLFMSFALAGSKDNAIKLGAMTITVSFLFVIGSLFIQLLAGLRLFQFMIIVLLLIPSLVVMAYLVQFYWEVLGETAGGEDELSWEQSAWDVWGDVVKPVMWLLVITLFCALPALGWWLFSSAASPDHEYVAVLLLVVGYFFWPMAVMWVSVGESLLYLRPDLMIRSVVVVGPSYLLVWVILLIALGLCYLSFAITIYWSFGVPGPAGMLLRIIAPLFGFAVDIYLGYVVFRTIGLIFRYHHEKLPLGF